MQVKSPFSAALLWAVLFQGIASFAAQPRGHPDPIAELDRLLRQLAQGALADRTSLRPESADPIAPGDRPSPSPAPNPIPPPSPIKWRHMGGTSGETHFDILLLEASRRSPAVAYRRRIEASGEIVDEKILDVRITVVGDGQVRFEQEHEKQPLATYREEADGWVLVKSGPSPQWPERLGPRRPERRLFGSLGILEFFPRITEQK